MYFIYFPVNRCVDHFAEELSVSCQFIFLYDLEHDESQPASANVIRILLGMELKIFTYLDIIMTFTICYILTFVDNMS